MRDISSNDKLNKNFYPRSPRGERQQVQQVLSAVVGFLSTLPARGATRRVVKNPQARADFYPRSPRGERHTSGGLCHVGHGVISIHAPREGSDCRTWYMDLSDRRFLSTLPARGATKTWTNWPTGSSNFYPRSPRGERLDVEVDTGRARPISIHAPREGSDGRTGFATAPLI